MELFYLLLLFVSFLCFSLLFLFYNHKSHFTATSLPPGNTGFPFIGETLELYSTGKKGLPEEFFFNRMAKYSSRVFKTSLLGHPTVVLCGAAGNKFLFSNENKLVIPWFPSSINKIFSSSFQDSSSEEASKKLRNLLPQFLKPEALQKYIGIMDNIAQRHFALDWENKEEVTVSHLVKKYTFWLACRLFLSIEDPNHVAMYLHPFHVLASGMVSIPINLPGTPFNRAIKASRFIRKEIREITKRRKIELVEGKASPTQDLLSHMLLATDENGRHMTEMDIEDKIIGLLIAGHETASVAITFTLKYLAEFPHIYNQVFKEQMEIAKLKAPGELLNWEDIQKMKYSWSVACEVMRLAPPAQGGFREVIHDFNFAGFSIPKGWKIYWSVNTTHKNPECFSEPEKFDPTRFEGIGPAPYTYVPFGAGPKMCPGKEYARLEILVFMHNIVKRFKWEKLIEDETITVDPFPTFAKGLPVRLHSSTGFSSTT